MNRLWLITKIQLMNVFRASKRNKSFLNLGSYAIGVIVMFGVGIYYAEILFHSLGPSQYSSVLYFMAYMVTLMIFIMSVSTSRGMLFGFKDLDLLKAMPFTEKEIVFSKAAVFTFTEYTYGAGLFLPVIVIYGIKAGAGILYYLFALLGFLALPLVPIVIASGIGMAFEKLSAGKKHADLIRNITGVVFFLAIYAGSMFSGYASGSSKAFVGMNPIFEKIFFITRWYISGAVSENILPVLAAMALSVIVYAAFLYLYAGTVMKINALTGQGYHVKNFRVKSVKANSVFITLFKKERDRFFHNFLYVFNTAFGMFLLVGFSIYIMFNRNATIEIISQIVSSNAELKTSMAQLFILGIVLLGQMTCTTSSTISLEGKCLWIMKTIPVTVKQVFWSKMLVNILLILIPSSFSLVLLGIDFGLELNYYLFGFLFIVIISFGVSMFGLLVNLLFPKLTYENEQEVIKQSMAAFLGVIVPMVAGIGMIGFFLSAGLENHYTFYILLTVAAVLDIAMYFILTSSGEDQYNSLI